MAGADHHRKPLAEPEAATWNDVRARVLTQLQEWREKPSAKKDMLWRRLSQLTPRAFAAEFDVEVEEVPTERRGRPARGYLPKIRVTPVAEARLRSSFGKTAIITDLARSELSDTELVEGLVTRGRIEEDFRWLKDRYAASAKPFYLWHDATVPGHAFLCVLGLLMLRYLQWELRELKLSMKQLVEALKGIKVVLIRTPEGKPTRVLEKMGVQEDRVLKALDWQRMIPG